MRYWFALAVLSIFLCGSVTGRRLETASLRATADSVSVVDAEINLAVGEFRLIKATMEKDVVAELNGEYSDRKFRYDYDFDHSGKRADFFFSSEANRHLKSIESGENRWELSFAPDIDLRLDIDVGAAETNFDLGGLAVSELKLHVGASDSKVDFSELNKTELTLFEVDAGACDLEIANIGNARFDRLEFEGGVGGFLLDFSGAFDFQATAEISVGLGSVDIFVPPDIGVRLETDDSFLSSIDFPKRKLKRLPGRGGVFETEDFSTAKGQLTIILEVGLGSAEIRFK